MKRKELAAIQYPEFVNRAYHILKARTSIQDFMYGDERLDISCAIPNVKIFGECQLTFYKDINRFPCDPRIIVSLLYRNIYFIDPVCIETGFLDWTCIQQIESGASKVDSVAEDPAELIRLFTQHPLHIFDQREIIHCRNIPVRVDDLWCAIGEDTFKVNSFEQIKDPSGFGTLAIRGKQCNSENMRHPHGLMIAAFSPAIKYFDHAPN